MVFGKIIEFVAATRPWKLLVSTIAFVNLCVIGVIVFLSPSEVKESQTALKDIPGEIRKRVAREREKASDHVAGYLKKGKDLVPDGVQDACKKGVDTVSAIYKDGQKRLKKVARQVGDDLEVGELSETGKGCWHASMDFLSAIITSVWIIFKFVCCCGCCIKSFKMGRRYLSKKDESKVKKTGEDDEDDEDDEGEEEGEGDLSDESDERAPLLPADPLQLD